MKATISEAKVEDLAEIDQFLDAQDQATPYHNMRWLMAVKKAYRFNYIYLLARIEGKIVGALPLCIFVGLSGKKELCSLPYCDVGGAVVDNTDIETQLLSYAKDIMNSAKYKGMEIRKRDSTKKLADQMSKRKVSMMLDLPENSEILMNGFKSKLRSQIRKSEKNGLSFDYSTDLTAIDDFYTVYSRNMHALGSPSHDINWFRELLKSYKENMLIGRVWYNDRIVGSGILLFNGINVSIPWASTLREYNHLAPNMLLYWNLLKLSCDKGCRVFDFGRSTYDEGTFKFKQQWGATPVLLDWQKIDQFSRTDESISNAQGMVRDLLEKGWQKMPFIFANYIGPKLRRHISL